MLHTLLFVHGYWSYRRISYMVNFICYKALLFAVPCFLFGFHSRFSAQRLWDGFNYTCYNVFYTSTPVMAIALLDHALPRSVLSNNVAAFREQKNKRFSARLFLLWCLRSIAHGCLFYFAAYWTLNNGHMGGDIGYSTDLWYFSLNIFFTMTTCVAFLALFDTYSFTAIHMICLVICSLGSLYVYNLVVPLVMTSIVTNGVVMHVFSQPQFWLLLIFCVLTVSAGEVFMRGLKIMLRPTMTSLLQERHLFWNKDQKHALRVTEQDEDLWKRRKKEKKGVRPDVKVVEAIEQEHDEATKEAIVRVMLRFRNLTGSQFESAASHLYQEHDAMVRGSYADTNEEEKHPGMPIQVHMP
jgi:magnesium-transporting ATPase (P-type)